MYNINRFWFNKFEEIRFVRISVIWIIQEQIIPEVEKIRTKFKNYSIPFAGEIIIAVIVVIIIKLEIITSTY